MKNEFYPLEPKAVREAIDDMIRQIGLFNRYNEGIIESYEGAVEACKKIYSDSRNTVIKLGGLEQIKIFPERLGL